MEKTEFLARYRDLLARLEEAPRDVPTWIELARHIDGRDLNYEECLASTEELRALDEKNLVPWSQYIWERVHELAPENLEALECLVEHRVDILDDPEGAAPYLDALLAVAPDHPRALHYAVVLASLNEDLDSAQRHMAQLCEVSPQTAIAHGTFDHFDENELTFLAAVAPKLLDALDAIDEPRGYERSLRALVASLPEGGPAALKRFAASSVPPGLGDLSVSDLKISYSARRFLEGEGVKTASAIVELSDATARECSLAIVREIKEALERHGVEFSGSK
jgi:hypothetical protein